MNVPLPTLVSGIAHKIIEKMTSANVVKCVKWTVFLFNLLFFLTGCGLIGCGVWLNVARDDWEGISDYSYMSVANIAIAAGVIVVMVAFLGCCGAITENKIMLLVFFVFLLVIFLLEISVCVAAYVMRGEVDNNLKEQLDKRIPERYYVETGVKTAMNAIQKSFECCGLYGVNDWNETVPNINIYVDQSCCVTNVDHLYYESNCKTEPWHKIQTESPSSTEFLKRYYQQGCYQSIKDFLKENLWVMVLVGAIFAALQIIGMVCAMLLYFVLRRASVQV